MLLIFLSWIYIFATTLIFGVGIKRLLNLEQLNSIITLFLGLFVITLFAGFWAIFFAVNIEFHISLLIISVLSLVINKENIKSELLLIIKDFKQLLPVFKGTIIVLFILILAQCASPPFVIDNESYYIQTIKWLNEYGLVKGLVNLHLFLGQTSGWHILQSAFSFSFVYEHFNDLSGFCLFLGNIYAITKLNAYFIASEKKATNLIIGLFPLFNVFFFQFISAPSADIAIYVLALIIFHLFIKCFSIYNRNAFIALVVLSVFSTLIKLTGLVFCFLPLVIYIKHYVYSKKTTVAVIIIGSITLGLFVAKNLIVTGNIIYPLGGIEKLNTSWSLPSVVETYFANYSKASSYGQTIETYEKSSALVLLKKWLMLPKLDGILNKAMILILLISPFIIRKTGNKIAFYIIYSLAILNLLLLFTITPQYRFFFPFLMFLTLAVLSVIIKNTFLIKASITGSVLIASVPLFVSFNNAKLTNTEYHTASSTFSTDYIIEPHSNSKYGIGYKSTKTVNAVIYSPTEIDFFWGTGNLPLPALNEQQLNYFRDYFNVMPQLRGDSIEEGFYSKILRNE